MNGRMKTKAITVAFLAVVLTVVVAQDIAIDRDSLPPGGETYSPYVGRNIPDRVYWGDTHLHTSYSTDAGMIGNYLGPDEAYQFARGEEVTASGGLRAKLIRPLDFLVVADHSENLGLAPLIEESDPKLLQNEFGRKVHDLVKAGKVFEAYGEWGRAMADRKDPIADDELASSIWERITAAAEEYNAPGQFTALIGFEWTSSYQANNLHRVVIFRDGADEANQIIPLSNYDSDDPEDLWRFLEEYEDKTGGRALALLLLRSQRSHPLLLAGGASGRPPGEEETAPGPGAENACYAVELRALILDSISRLPRGYRRLMRLWAFEDIDYAEIGKRLGVSIAVVKSRVYRGRVALRRSLARRLERETVGRKTA